MGPSAVILSVCCLFDRGLIVVWLCCSNYPRVVVEKFRASASVGSIKIEQTNFVVCILASCSVFAVNCFSLCCPVQCSGVRCVSPRGQAAVALFDFRSACGRRPQRRCAHPLCCAPSFPFHIFLCLCCAGAKAVIAEVRKKHGDKVVLGGFPRLITEVRSCFCVCVCHNALCCRSLATTRRREFLIMTRRAINVN